MSATSEPPPTVHGPRDDHGKLDLILWRLERMESTIDGTVGRREYEIKHGHLSGRVEALEDVAEATVADHKKIILGLILALALPVGNFIINMIQAMEGIPR